MIGSQVTKGMHILARFVPTIVECGVWSNGKNLAAIEAYPLACKRSETIQTLHRPDSALSHADWEDALTCALVSSLLAEKRSALMPPATGVSPSEGWVGLPREAFAQDAASSDCTECCGSATLLFQKNNTVYLKKEVFENVSKY